MFLIRKDSKGNPLIIWINPPGLEAELTPTRARELAEQLQMVANCAEEGKDKIDDGIQYYGGNQLFKNP